MDGDRLIALIAREWFESGALTGSAVVGTPFSNYGFERYLGTLQLDLLRAPVGDRHVSQWMRSHGCNVGGEPSGHIILANHSGDGRRTGLSVAGAVRHGPHGQSPVRIVCPATKPFRSINPMSAFRTDGTSTPSSTGPVRAVVKEAEQRLLGKGRLIVRPSGYRAAAARSGRDFGTNRLPEKSSKSIATAVATASRDAA